MSENKKIVSAEKTPIITVLENVGMLRVKDLETQKPVPGERAFVSGLNMPESAVILRPEMGDQRESNPHYRLHKPKS